MSVGLSLLLVVFFLAMNVAKKLSEAFGGTLPISYSGGADAGPFYEDFSYSATYTNSNIGSRISYRY